MSRDMPKPGEKWLLKPVPDPWGGTTYPPVTILDVKDGWVRYSMTDTVLTDERSKLVPFMRLYRSASEGDDNAES